MRIILGADHRGFPLKEQLKAWLATARHAVEDVGATKLDPADDYPDFGAVVGRAVAADPSARGIVVCGSGVGIVIAANKIAGVRAGTVASPEQAASARRDEDLNVLGLSSDALDFERAKSIVATFLDTPYSGLDRHARRVKKLSALDA
ncbi:RpiB/LacA/LacB family sugar-phosphate isomerase [Candidatus Uhrbacteria bacterium]|nr:RpiB/LacA/LacB family sugar-phosphate isomerase [Candidatus Uhrbacteria bacterium]